MGGEKVKKAVLVIAVALMAVAMLATPVLAASPNKTPVTASNLATLGSEYDPLTFRWITDGNISHIVYMKLWGTLQINVDGEVIPVNWVDILSGTYNMKTLKGVWKWDEVWTLPNGDTFEGTAHVNRRPASKSHAGRNFPTPTSRRRGELPHENASEGARRAARRAGRLQPQQKAYPSRAWRRMRAETVG
jgi:hypothetical protein